jgi:hypothetical protein
VNCGAFYVVRKMERETRIELATNSLEGCDSTIELLPLLISIITSSVSIRPPTIWGLLQLSRGSVGTLDSLQLSDRIGPVLHFQGLTTRLQGKNA